MLAAEFEPQDYKDEFRQRVLEMIEAKARGKTLRRRVPRQREPDEDLRHALEASLRGSQKRA